MLFNLVNYKLTGTTAILKVADWNRNSKQQTITVDGVTPTNIVIASAAPASLDDYTMAGILCIELGNNSLTFSYKFVPENNITINMVIV